MKRAPTILAPRTPCQSSRSKVLLALGLGAIISSGLLASPAPAARKKTPAAPTVTIPKLAGAPVLVGWVSAGGIGANEALLGERFVNTHGGVSGRPLKIVTCSTKGTPPSAKSCANQLIAKKVKLVLEGSSDVGWLAAAEVFRVAKVLVLGGSPTGPSEFNDPNAIYLAPAQTTVSAATGVYATATDRPRAVSILVSTNRAAHDGLPLAVGALKAAGVNPVITTLTEGKADPAAISAAIKAAIDAPPNGTATNAVFALLSVDQCVGVMQEAKAQAFSGRLITTETCLAPTVLADAGDAAENWVFLAARPRIDTQPQHQAFIDYRDTATKLKVAISTDPIATLGFMTVVDGASLLSKLESSVLDAAPGIVGATIKSYMSRSEATSTYLQSTYAYKRSKLFPSVANFAVHVAQRSGGQFVLPPGSGPDVGAFLG